MLLNHFFINKIAHSSYILAGSDVCAVIDPQRDIDIYIDEAREPDAQADTASAAHCNLPFQAGFRPSAFLSVGL